MKKNFTMTCLFIFIFSCNWLNISYAKSSQDPVGLLQYIANNMIEQLKVNQATLKTKPQVVYALARRYVVPHADLAEMSRQVLPPHIWNNASASQRQQFQREFTTLLIRTYASALTSYRDQTVQFFSCTWTISKSAHSGSKK